MAGRPEPTVSAVLIVKDEEAVLAACLAALGWVDELVVYDTGSSDRTREIAREFTERVVDGYWDDDFGAARNRALEHATGEWVFSVDADEVFEGDPERVRRTLATGRADLWLVPVHSGGRSAHSALVTARVFRREHFHFRGRLHEQIVEVDGRKVAIETLPDVRLMHSGYTPEVLEGKRKDHRNVAIARRELAESRAAGAERFEIAMHEVNLARSLVFAGEHEEALELAASAEASGLVPDLAMRQLAAAAVQATVAVGRPDEAEAWLDRWEHADDSPVWSRTMRARLRLFQHRPADAGEILEALPSTTVDADGRRYVKHETADVLVACLAATGRLRDAFRAACAAVGAGYTCGQPADVVRVLDAARRPLVDWVRSMDEGAWRAYAVWATREGDVASRRLLLAMAEHRPRDLTVLLCAAGLAPVLPLDELVHWASGVRGVGLDDACPLVRAAGDDAVDARLRALAAAMAVSVYGDGRAVPLLEAALAQVRPEDEAELLGHLDVVAPGLVSAGV